MPNLLLCQVIHEVSEFYPLPNQTISAGLNASMQVKADKDSIYISLDVSDNHINENDKIGIWLAMEHTQYTDYVVGYVNKKPFIFRNSEEASISADPEGMYKNADYPTGLITMPNGKKIKPLVPSHTQLKTKPVYYGLTHFILSVKGKEITLEGKSSAYKEIEELLQAQLPDLTKEITYSIVTTEKGYKAQISLHNKCLGFAKAGQTNAFRLAVDIESKSDDKPDVTIISSVKNRYFARPYYFDVVKSASPFSISALQIPDYFIEQTGLIQYCMITKEGWKPFGVSIFPIQYGGESISELNLMQLHLFPYEVSHEKRSILKTSYDFLQLNYNDHSYFPQQEVYFLFPNGKNQSSKGYRYNGAVKNNFINSLVTLPDGSMGIVLYDAEVYDPLGHGEFGTLADEVVNLYQLDGNNEKELFSLGFREANGKLNIGNGTNPDVYDGVNGLNFYWLEQGFRFQIELVNAQKKVFKTLTYRISKNLSVVKEN